MITIEQLNHLNCVYHAGEWNDVYTARILRECRIAVQSVIVLEKTLAERNQECQERSVQHAKDTAIIADAVSILGAISNSDDDDTYPDACQRGADFIETWGK